MFTGLIQHVGVVERVEQRAAGVRLSVRIGGVEMGSWGYVPELGASIAVDGCCLTVSEFGAGLEGGVALFDVVAETLEKTTLGSLEAGARVNLEHALRADALLGGHFVQGHVDGVGEVVEIQRDPSDWRMTVRVPAELAKYATPKGSICISGVSLTIARLDADRIGVALIPTTLSETTLGELSVGDRVNIEADVLAKMVVHHLERFGQR